MAQRVKILTSVHEDVGLIPGLHWWVGDLALCLELWCRSQTRSGSSSELTPSLGTSLRPRHSLKKKQKKKKKKEKKKKMRASPIVKAPQRLKEKKDQRSLFHMTSRVMFLWTSSSEWGCQRADLTSDLTCWA